MKYALDEIYTLKEITERIMKEPTSALKEIKLSWKIWHQFHISVWLKKFSRVGFKYGSVQTTGVYNLI